MATKPILTLEIRNSGEFESMYEALGQYCENQRDYLNCSDKPDPVAAARLQEAEKFLGKFDTLLAALADKA